MERRADLPRSLRVLRREREGVMGRSEVCRGSDGTDWVRLRIFDEGCRRAALSTLDRRSAARVRVERDGVALLFPCREGMSLRRWLAGRPGLGERRDACLALLGRVLEDRPPPAVLALSAMEENLRFSNREAWLLYLPDWVRQWEGLGDGDAVGALAVLALAVLTGGLPAAEERRFPPELRLIRLRAERNGYTGWDQLIRDLAALPDALPDLKQAGSRILREAERRTRPWRRYVAGAMAAALLLAAALSLTAAFREWRTRRAGLFQGITSIGDQKLG